MSSIFFYKFILAASLVKIDIAGDSAGWSHLMAMLFPCKETGQY